MEGLCDVAKEVNEKLEGVLILRLLNNLSIILYSANNAAAFTAITA